MAKLDVSKKIHKRRTEQEMRSALYDLRIGCPVLENDIDDTDTVFSDCIEELLELRQEREDVRGFVQTMHAKMNRR